MIIIVSNSLKFELVQFFLDQTLLWAHSISDRHSTMTSFEATLRFDEKTFGMLLSNKVGTLAKCEFW